VAKTKKSKPSSVSLLPAVKTLLRVCFAGAIVGGAAYGYHRLCNQVEFNLAVPSKPPRIILKNQPPWMNDELADQIVRSIAPKIPRSAMDHELLKEVADKLAQNPWVKSVQQVRRAFTDSVGDTIEIACQYRAPVALVSTGKSDGNPREYLLVDGDGVRLPPTFPIAKSPNGRLAPPQIMFAENHSINLRVIDGVGAAPPTEGKLWTGDDLQAGLDLAKLLYGKPFAQDIYRIDVSNYKRRWPERGIVEIVLLTKDNTRILWGEPVRSTFFSEKPPQEKLDRLSAIVKQYGRVDANHSWIDIRLDKVLYPEGENLVQGN
jgi:hypothetical protein